MQLDKVVQFHKALADVTRVKILILLATGEHSGLALAEKLCVSTATITHHATKLREASLINERRDKNTIFFSINDYFIRRGSTAVVELIYKNAEEANTMDDKNKRMKESVLKNFFTLEGKLKHLPAQLKKKVIVLEELASKLEMGQSYTEKEMNSFIKLYHDDYATIRREFIMHQFMYRDKEIYELNPQEMWERWEALR